MSDAIGRFGVELFSGVPVVFEQTECEFASSEAPFDQRLGEFMELVFGGNIFTMPSK
jgi:hypothetical protein